MERAVTAAVAALALLSAGPANAQSLRGSPAAMQKQNRVALQHDFTFLQTSAQVRRFVQNGHLVPLPGNADYELASVSHPYARPAVRTFVERLAAQYRAACGEKLVVTSLTRPVLEQPRNASDLSVHPAGMAVDLRISRKASCVRWLERTLLSLEKQGVLDATRESRPPHYHVALFPTQYGTYLASIGAAAPARVAAAQSAPAARSTTAASSSAPQPVATLAAADAAPETEPAPRDALLVTANVAPERDAETEELRAYRVNRGDTLWSIARRYNTTVDTLKTINSLRSSRINAGQRLMVPVTANGAD